MWTTPSARAGVRSGKAGPSLARCATARKETDIHLSPPIRDRQSFRHEALLWSNADDYRELLVPFVEEGLAGGEPVMVATIAEHEEWLRDGLGASARSVRFVDMAAMGRNPSRIIPAWQSFLDSAERGQPIRGIGEPIWPGRRPQEIAECQLHEALLNIAVDPGLPFWLVCPYDVAGLGSSVVEAAACSHPALLQTDGYHGSGGYGGRAHVDSLFTAVLDELSGVPTETDYRRSTVGRLYPFVATEASRAGLSPVQASGLAAASQRLAAGSLQRGAESGRLAVWDQPDAVICELRDDVTIVDPLVGRRRPLAADIDGLWYVNQHSDLVRLRSNADGTTVRIHVWK
ncbi:sensor histidine kinase [Microlunatus ginsengisoli]|uniref:Sensor histidine kinase n=1 Tax=Microlunatus ginsengisoli TaxID=363863 RepID=A0ABP7A7I4_9ACTN